MEIRRIGIESYTLFDDNTITIEGDAVERMRKVLRIKQGKTIELIPGTGDIFVCEFVEFLGKKQASLRLLEKKRPQTESPRPFILALPFLKHHLWDDIVRLGTELGVTHFQPLITERSLVSNPHDVFKRRLRRWKKIAMESLESSKRTRQPSFSEPQHLLQFLQNKKEHEHWMCLIEPARTDIPVKRLWEIHVPLQKHEALVVLSGPEGGWDKKEIEIMVKQGCIPVTLGVRTFRSLTAVIVACSLLQPYLQP